MPMCSFLGPGTVLAYTLKRTEDVIKALEMGSVPWIMSGWVPCNHKGPGKEEVAGSDSEESEVRKTTHHCWL